MKFIGVYDYTVIVTYLSLVSGVVGMSLAFQGKIGAAIICLAISGICDMFDGVIARTKKNRTQDEKNFGIQIDSLCDAISFGVFPAVLCYHMGVSTAVGVVILMLYVLILMDCIQIALSLKNQFSSFVVIGITALFMIQVLINLGVVVGLFPVTGITLPFLSYGGSSLVMLMGSFGLIIGMNNCDES